MMEQVTSGSKKGTKQLLRMLPGLRSEDESSQDSGCCSTSTPSSSRRCPKRPALWLPPAQLHPEVLCLRPV